MNKYFRLNFFNQNGFLTNEPFFMVVDFHAILVEVALAVCIEGNSSIAFKILNDFYLVI